MGVAPTKEYGSASLPIVSRRIDSLSHNGPRELAIVAAGCFWGVELAFQRIPGVVKTNVGYTDGDLMNPTYEQVCSGRTRHTEAVQIEFDPTIVKYDELLTVFFDIHDPTTRDRQGNDVGTQYRSGIYYFNDEQKNKALQIRDKFQKKYDNPIVTDIKLASRFFLAEDYHQQYLQKNGQSCKKGDLTPMRCYG